MPPRSRLVTGNVREMTLAPYERRSITFELVEGGFTADTQFATRRITVPLDDSGNLITQVTSGGTTTTTLGVALWTNTDSLSGNSFYRCDLGDGKPFDFSLPYGDGSDIDLGTLRSLGVPAADNQTLLDFIGEQVSESGSSPVPEFSAVAGEQSSALRWVYLAANGQLYKANNNSHEECVQTIGILLNSVELGASATARTGGIVSDPSFSFATGPVFLGLDGQSVQGAAASANGFLCQVGRAIGPTQIYIGVQAPIAIN